ncbi:hypothetical protein TRICI_006012 [Trichomonascus ciferrii]|uniref:Methyltransferase type 11 domain-containing protein n=1 Tax=Trichomonascus ciferrii TaxID=44093 RepID=A0A642UMK2_9ASCO|nr:hypothetical protein TRICI_006012 [Trichomonascus ciferrii]
MASFASKTFSAASYLAARPRYPASLYNYVIDYCRKHCVDGRLENALDVGCGPGANTAPLLESFEKVCGVDPSPGMIEQAKKQVTDAARLSFYQGTEQDFADSISPESIDLITVAQAIHWFDAPKFYDNVYRALKPNGTVAFWGYLDPVFVDHPKVSDLHMECLYGENALGPYWEPGRKLLREKLVFADPPTDRFTDIERVENMSLQPDMSSPIELHRQCAFSDYISLMKTASSYHNWKQVNPNSPDVVDTFAQQAKQLENWSDNTQITIKWLTVLVLATKN